MLLLLTSKMASSKFELLKNIVSDREQLQILGWKAALDFSEECLFIKRENSTSFIRIDTNFKIIGVRCRQKVFEIKLKKLTLEGISKVLVLLETELPDAVPHEKIPLLDPPKPVKVVPENYFETNNNSTRPRNSRKPTHLKIFSCSICEKSFYRKEKLEEHQARDHKGHIWRCNFCPKEFRFMSQLTQHERVTHGPPIVMHEKVTNNVEAENSSKTLEVQISEVEEEIQILPKKKKKAYCEICKDYFGCNFSLRRHEKSKTHKQNLAKVKEIQANVEKNVQNFGEFNSSNSTSEMPPLRLDSTDAEQDSQESAPMIWTPNQDMYEVLKAKDSTENLKIILKKIDSAKYSSD